jgi:hypothetical protein
MSFILNHVLHFQSYNSFSIMFFIFNHVIYFQSCHSCEINQIMSFIFNHVIHFQACHSCEINTIMSFIFKHAIHFQACHSFSIMSFLWNHVILVKSCLVVHVMCHWDFSGLKFAVRPKAKMHSTVILSLLFILAAYLYHTTRRFGSTLLMLRRSGLIVSAIAVGVAFAD